MVENETKQIKAFFKETDLDGNGRISKEEMANVFRAIGDWTDDELQELFAEADLSGDGILQYDEFVNWVMEDEIDVEEAREEVQEALAEGDEENNDADEADAEGEADALEVAELEAEVAELDAQVDNGTYGEADADLEANECEGEVEHDLEGEDGANQSEAEGEDDAEDEVADAAAEVAELEAEVAELEAQVDDGTYGKAAADAEGNAEEGDAVEEAAAEEGVCLDLSTCSLEEVLQSSPEKLSEFWIARRGKIKKEGNIAIGKHITCETSFDGCGPGLMITGNGCDAKKWIGNEGVECHNVILTFPLPAEITELFIVWGQFNEVADLRVSATTADEEEIVVADFSTVISPAEGKTPSTLPGELSLTYIKPEAPLENVKTLLLTMCVVEECWVSACDLVVHGVAPVPPPPPPLIECDCADVIDALRAGPPCDFFQEDGTAAEAVSKKNVLLTDGIKAIDEINAACQDAGGSFVDVDFPADDTSIWGVGELGDAARGADAEMSGPSCWKRLSQSMPDAQLFMGGIDMNDVQQGAVGDCWLISVIASLACVPEHLKGLIYPQEMNPYGAYAVRFYSSVSSEWMWVVVDDVTPMDACDVPYFMKAQDPKEIWPIIMEKAFAKVNSCYSGLNPGVACGGTCAMKMVSGNDEVLSWVGKKFEGPDGNEHDVDAVWEEICKAVEAGCAAACGVADEKWAKKSNAEMDEIGVVYNHVFSCVGRYALEDGTRLLRLRNPWGEGGEWKGPWSDKSEEWTEDRKAEIPDYTDKNDGTFFITVEDFYDYWYRLEICYLKPLVPLGKLIEGKRGQS